MTLLADRFASYLPVIEADLRTVLTPPEDAPELFYRMLHYHMGWVDASGQLANGDQGKRIRPVLALLSCESVCGSMQPARPAAAAIELVHNFSLLHDDIQDRSPTRRSRPTVWAIWGEAHAINAGDALFALARLAIPRLAGPQADPAVMLRTLEIFDEICLDLTRGQYLDLSFEPRDQVSTDEYLHMIGGKTAAMLAAAPHLGALAAGASPDRQAHYRAFGHNLGMAFQALDDVLDIWGDPALTGKEAAVDIYQRKKSLPVLYGLERSPALRDLYAQPGPFDQAAVSQAIALLDEAEARQYAEHLALLYSERTISHLEAAEPQGEAGQALFELVDYLLARDR